MIQYILDNIISFGIGLTFIVATLIFGLFFLMRASIRSGQERYNPLAFGLALLAFAGAHIIWNLRATFFPPHSAASLWFPYWQGFWVLFISGITLLGLWSLVVAYPDWLNTKKWILIVLLIPWLIVVIDILLVTNPESALLVCSAQIWDLRPDLIVLLATALPFIFYIGVALDYYYGQFKAGVDQVLHIPIITGLLFIVIGGILDTKAYPDCPIITMGRMLMLGGLLLTSFSLLRFAPKPPKE
ncbi:MAG: hypothetical protein Q6364_00315 [Candidatus Hermodarchaeota archaeon]|nr:hypothetical protein [Candidatus Hermodarchaeota archaeon]